jgi:hypothetical protein
MERKEVRWTEKECPVVSLVALRPKQLQNTGTAPAPTSGRVACRSRDFHVTIQERPKLGAYISFALFYMDYLRTLGSAAVSTIVQKSGLNLPFSLGKKHPSLDPSSIWSLYDATKRV